ncbi:MAG: paraslipin [Leptospiraceae bacterium]|nr:paraslipin [Leptospiraceae bacterium]
MSDFFTVLVIIALVVIYKTIVIVPFQFAYVKERFGKKQDILNAGYHFLLPFVDQIAYEHSLKEVAYDVPPQECITRDNVPVNVDGILYIRVIDPERASYEINDYLIATTQLAKTTLRAEIGKLNLDDTFAEREEVNSKVISQLDQATDPWGIKVTRYEIRNITPPPQVLQSMELQMKAERDKRSEITISEGDKASRINRSMGERQESINISEGEKQKRINEAEGKALEIEYISSATANGLKLISKAIAKQGGKDAVNLQIAQAYLDNLGKLFTTSKTTVLPPSVANIAATFEGLSKITNQLPNSGQGGNK